MLEVKNAGSIEIPSQFADAVSREVASYERIEWVGRPKPTYFIPESTNSLLFGIFFTGLNLYILLYAAGFWGPVKNGGILATLWMIPFVLLGIGMMLEPFFRYRWGLQTLFVITDCRVIEFTQQWAPKVKSFTPDKLRYTYRRTRSDGTGDVMISRRAWRDHLNDRRLRRGAGFRCVPDVVDFHNRVIALAERGGGSVHFPSS